MLKMITSTKQSIPHKRYLYTMSYYENLRASQDKFLNTNKRDKNSKSF